MAAGNDGRKRDRGNIWLVGWRLELVADDFLMESSILWKCLVVQG